MTDKKAPQVWYKHPAFIVIASILFLEIFISSIFRTFLGTPLKLAFWISVIVFTVFLIRNYKPTSKTNIKIVEINYIGTDLYFKETQQVIDAYQTRIRALKKEENELWGKLGATPEEREKNINKLFDEKNRTLSYSTRLSLIPEVELFYGPFIQFKISRNLATIPPRELEFLRIAFLMENELAITPQFYEFYLFSLIYGDGKASIDSYSYDLNGYNNLRSQAYRFKENGTRNPKKYLRNIDTIKDGSTTLKYYQDQTLASVESAITNILKEFEMQKANGKLSKKLSNIERRIHGSNAWFSEDDIPNSIFDTKSEYTLKLGHLEESDNLLNYSGEGSLITIAPPGSGKSQCFVIPNMLAWKGAAVVLDIKGEIYNSTHAWREQNIGKTFKFSPSDFRNSCSFNPLTFIRQDPDYIWEDSRFLADMMIVPSKSSDPFWENMARDVVTAAISHVCFLAESEARGMSKLMDLIYGIDWDEMILSLKTNPLVASMRRVGHALSEIDPKQKDSVLKTAQSSLSAWQGERISKVTEKSDWNPLDLRNQPITVYICINPNELESYLSVIRVIIAQHIRSLATELPKHGVSPVLFMLDELPRLKKMPPVDEALHIGRQYGLKLWMFAQSYGQLKDAYTDPDGLLGSCSVRTFMNLAINDELTQKISDQLGFKQDTFGNNREKLVEPRDLAGPNFKDTILVLATSTKPAKLKKRFAFDDPELVAKMKL